MYAEASACLQNWNSKGSNKGYGPTDFFYSTSSTLGYFGRKETTAGNTFAFAGYLHAWRRENRLNEKEWEWAPVVF